MKLKDPRLLFGLVCIVALAAAPMVANQGLLFLIGLTMAQAVFALSWNLLFRYSGIASFGHSMFYGIGAYTMAAIIAHHVPIPFLASLVIAIALGGAVAFVIGLIILPRTNGIQLAILTLALSQLVLLFVSYSDLLGRDEGLSGLSRPRIDMGAFTIDLTSPNAYYYFILIVCTAATAGLLWFVSGSWGRTLLAVAIDAERAAFLGINVLRQRIAAFTLAGAVAALCGAIVAPWAQIVSVDALSWLTSAQPMLATLLGGAGSFWGPVTGAFALALINYMTRTLPGLSELIVGGTLLAVVLLAPAGIYGLVQTLSRSYRRYGHGSRQGAAT